MPRVIVLPKPHRLVVKVLVRCRGFFISTFAQDKIALYFLAGAVSIGIFLAAAIALLVKTDFNLFTWLGGRGSRFGHIPVGEKFLGGIVVTAGFTAVLIAGFFDSEPDRTFWWGIYLLLAALLGYLSTWLLVYGRF